MDDQDITTSTSASARRWGAAAALVAAGLAGGVVIAGTVTANAADSTPSPSTSQSSGAVAGSGSSTAPIDPSKSQRSDETLLTGDTADKVTAAALAKYPGATVERVETDSDGVYEAHIVTTDGKHLVVAVDKDFAVTGSKEMTGGPQGGRPGGAQGGSGSTTPSTAPSASSTA
ncbi:MAG: hypothetical protein U0S36_11385 [Candidatus Nanopelagicales bacterium]